MDPCCDPEVRHGSRCRKTMFTKQVSRPVNIWIPMRGPPRPSSSIELDDTWSRARSEVLMPYRLCPRLTQRAERRPVDLPRLGESKRLGFLGGDRALATTLGRHHGQAIRIDSSAVDD